MKKQVSIKMTLLSINAICICFCFLIFSSCTKGNFQGEALQMKKSGITVKDAKDYFELLLTNEKTLTNKPILISNNKFNLSKKLVKNGHINQNNRLTQISRLLLWDQPTISAKGNYILIPFAEDIHLFKNKEFEYKRELAFYKDSSQNIKLTIIEIFGNKNAPLGNNAQNIISSSFERETFSANSLIPDTRAAVIFYSEKYQWKKSFQIENGNLIPKRILLRSDLDINVK
jgi:hypothetical protein